MLEQCRHLSYSMGYAGDFEKLEPLFKLEQLRTLLPIKIQLHYYLKLSKSVLHNVLPRLTSLRALSLAQYQVQEFPDDLFIKLKLLRFLDLSGAVIKKLPDSICALYNLETLILSSCADLEELPLQMEKLVNLRHLDISNTSHLKMSLHLSKLKSLQVLVGAKFLVGGSRMEDLGEAQNLYGSLTVLELQTLVDRREAVKAKMREKNHVEYLWSGVKVLLTIHKLKETYLMSYARNKNMKELKISRYRGTKFPNWVADPFFLKNCVQMCVSNCKNCDSLPALGQLPSLKFLSIDGMHGITVVTEEFYGSSSSKKPFNSLEKLEFDDMPEWKLWHALDFPKLQTLSIRNCAKLMGKLPENLCSLIELRISGCPELSLEAPIQLSSLKRFEAIGSSLFEKLCIVDFSILPSTLKEIQISGCQKLKLEGPIGEMFLEKLELKECDDISPELLPRARKLRVQFCDNLTRFLIPERLNIRRCKNVEIFSAACGGAQMTYLYISDCLKLKWLPEGMQELLPSLKQLVLSNCPEIESCPSIYKSLISGIARNW